MKKNEISTEDKIIHAAYSIFLVFGYYGTKLPQIASKAGVNKSAIHYYFRSKDKLYAKVVKLVIDIILTTKLASYMPQEAMGNPVWFLFTELYNNPSIFEQTIKELYPDDWESKLTDVNNWLEFSNVPLTKKQ